MAFVNEYASEEDIKKYDLLNVWRESLGNPNFEPNMWFKYDLTIDREKNVFFSLLKAITETGASGLEDHTKGLLFIFWHNDKKYLVTLQLADGTSVSIREVPYIKIWNLLNISNEITSNLEAESDVIPLLKEALISRGGDSRLQKIANVQVKFNF